MSSATRLALCINLCAALVAAFLSSESTAAAELPGRVLVPAITIYPGETIKDEWLTERDISSELAARASVLVISREAIVGKVSRRTLLPGSPIPLNAIAEPKVVVNGAKVRIVFEDDVLAITAYGTALQAGSAGDVVSVRNLASGLTISGIVQADGSVRVGGS